MTAVAVSVSCPFRHADSFSWPWFSSICSNTLVHIRGCFSLTLVTRKGTVRTDPVASPPIPKLSRQYPRYGMLLPTPSSMMLSANSSLTGRTFTSSCSDSSSHFWLIRLTWDPVSQRTSVSTPSIWQLTIVRSPMSRAIFFSLPVLEPTSTLLLIASSCLSARC